MNITVLQGRLTRPPESKALPSGDHLVAYEVTVPAVDGRPAESAPVVWFSAPPSAMNLEPETEVVVVGRVRRRFFRTGTGITQSRTEVVADVVVPARQAKKAARLVVAALSRAEEALTGVPV